MSGIKVEGLAKVWGDFRAVGGISFETKPAEFVALLGPSGCGKSTTLRLIAGLETATSGRIVIDGRDVSDLPSAERNLSMVFQSYALFPHLSVSENITFGLSVRRVPKAEQARRLARIVDLLGLGTLLSRRPSQLSGGQQQRVALGRALIAETPVCLLDEPLSNLDAQLRSEMRNEIRSLQRRLGITMVFVTHDQTEAMSMADRVILMRDGLIEQNGAPAELYEQPASVAVARFIGTPPMNVVDLEPGPGGATIAGADGPPLAALGDTPLQLGIRPEHITFADEGFAAVVEGSEYFGADTITACRVGAQRMLVRTPGKPSLSPGAAVKLHWPATAAHLFDRDTGRRRPDAVLPTQQDTGATGESL
ncbi:ABC transporter ATP-binding protein [Alsobacter metallidurans]|uniref:ABC transporter ATP-binding protein n=1 Tax=Alsobacter metallidurans TaxID=340221 RepID=A0A917IBC4_9HYPH|nr:ABC transporter ATP-binding protein [Alsobacter metallidurans]GGH31755.1 ABC transporter ATP-binding protein [Alsobacter metallidurans]